MYYPLVINFENFKSLSKEKRIYYYNGENFYDLYFFHDGMVIKTILPKAEIENTEKFFADAMFYGAMEAKFQFPNPFLNPLENIEGIKVAVEKPKVVEENQPEEVKQTDNQKEGIDE